jgi:hypothetical protein
MGYTSSVQRLANDQYVTIRASYVKICNGNPVAAALISFFETWHNYKLKQIADWQKMGNKKDSPNTWQHHTGKELEQGIMGIGKRHSIDQAKQQLASMGVIVIGRNPDYKFAFDATLHYQFQPDVVTSLLAYVENSKTSQYVEIDIAGDAETDKPAHAENSGAIPNQSTNQTPDEPISGAGAPVDKNPDKKRDTKRKAPGADKDWQRWVDLWFQFYEDRHQVKPMFNATQASALKKLRVYLCSVSKSEENITAEEAGFASWGYILQRWNDLGDEWLQGQFDLTVVLKKINDILNRLRNATNTNRGTHPSGNGKLSPGAARFEAIKNY